MSSNTENIRVYRRTAKGVRVVEYSGPRDGYVPAPVPAPLFKVVRNFFEGRSRTIAKGLTLAEAQRHCQDPETSSSTCTSAEGKARTRRSGPWFDGYDEM